MSIELVKQFHDKFELPLGDQDVLSKDIDLQEFRVGFLYEELEELEAALIKNDRVKAFDALLDLVYVAHGTALCMGISPEQWHAGMEAVQQANMSKVRCSNAGESKRGSSFDVRKPEGWSGPETTLERILSWEN